MGGSGERTLDRWHLSLVALGMSVPLPELPHSSDIHLRLPMAAPPPP